MFKFTFSNLKKEYEALLKSNYKIIKCDDFALNNDSMKGKHVINRIDIDYSVKKAEAIGNIFEELGITGTFFLRLHAPEYNVFSFENYRIIKKLISNGNEIGYHSEIVDQSNIWNESASSNLVRDIKVLESIFGIKVKGVASHGGNTGFNNLDFWKNKRPSDYGLVYEAYEWFSDVFYVSDSEWTQWKCYKNGKLVKEDRRSPSQHLDDNHNTINLLIHSDTYFEKHFYE